MRIHDTLQEAYKITYAVSHQSSDDKYYWTC